MTPQEIETASRRMLNASGSKFWSQDEIISGILYQAAMELAIQTLCIENRYTTPSVVSQAEYQRPSRAISIKRIEYNGQKLTPIDYRKYDSINTNLLTVTTGTPAYYTEFDDAIILFPAPDTVALDIKIYTYDEPSVPTATSTLEIPTKYHPSLIIGVAYFMSLKELGHPNTILLQNLWLKAIDDIKRIERSKKRGDAFTRVNTEETLPGLTLGVV